MKYILLGLFFIFTNIAYSQNYGNSFMPGDIGYNLDRITNAGLSSCSEEAAMINAQADYVYKSSLANINNQKARALELNNEAMRASVFFEKRQINRYNRALEDLQTRQISKMRRDGTLTKEELDHLFDVRYKTGYIIP